MVDISKYITKQLFAPGIATISNCAENEGATASNPEPKVGSFVGL